MFVQDQFPHLARDQAMRATSKIRVNALAGAVVAAGKRGSTS
jgi:hypothetical protein